MIPTAFAGIALHRFHHVGRDGLTRLGPLVQAPSWYLSFVISDLAAFIRFFKRMTSFSALWMYSIFESGVTKSSVANDNPLRVDSRKPVCIMSSSK